jgi:hypothetical protein
MIQPGTTPGCRVRPRPVPVTSLGTCTTALWLQPEITALSCALACTNLIGTALTLQSWTTYSLAQARLLHTSCKGVSTVSNHIFCMMARTQHANRLKCQACICSHWTQESQQLLWVLVNVQARLYACVGRSAHRNILSIRNTRKLFKMRRVLKDRSAESEPPSPPVRIITTSSVIEIATTMKSKILKDSEK